MDNQILKLAAGLILSYLLGAIPFAYLFGKIIKGIDLRQHGSGNLGATNAFRVLGKTIGTSVLILDILKGTAAVLIAKSIFFHENSVVSENLYLCLAAIAAISGHNWTVFLNFKGGKGIATSFGVLLAFSIIIKNFIWLVVSLIIMWILIFLFSGFVSLASVICSIILVPLALFFSLPKEILLFLGIIAAFSIIRHKPNIIRLLQKKEHRFNIKKTLSR